MKEKEHEEGEEEEEGDNLGFSPEFVLKEFNP
jgi:hypothetical protein